MMTQLMNRVPVLSAVISGMLAVAALANAPTANAFDFGNEGCLTGSLDTTVSLGGAWRVAAQNPALIGTANGGSGRSVNIDDGDRPALTGPVLMSVTQRSESRLISSLSSNAPPSSQVRVAYSPVRYAA